MKKKLVFNAVRIIISVGLIAFLFWLMKDNVDDITSTIKKTNPSILLVSFLVVILSVVIVGARLMTVMKAQNLKISFKEATYLTFIGIFFNNFLPTAAGGDLVKSYYAAKKTGKKLSSVACILLDRILGTSTLILFLFVSSFFVKEAPSNRLIFIFLLIAIAVLITVFSLMFNKGFAKKIPFADSILKKLNIKDKIKALYDVMHNYKSHPKLLLNAVALSIVLQLMTFYGVFLMVRSLDLYVPLKFVFLVMPIVITASMAPSINGLGVRESSFVFFFGPLIGKGGAFALSILWLGIFLGMSVIGGVIYIFNKEFRIAGKEALHDR